MRHLLYQYLSSFHHTFRQTQKLIYKAKTDSGPIKDKIIEDLKNELGRVRGMGRETFESVEQQIQEKPLMSLLIAFILGLLLGKLLDRR